MVYCRNQHSSIQFLQDKIDESEFTKFIQVTISHSRKTFYIVLGIADES